MAIGTRRKGTFVRWRVWIPRALLTRVETFYHNPHAARKRVYGYRSQLITGLLSDWAAKTDTSFSGAGKRRHNSPEMEEVSISVPTELADKIGQLAPASAGPIFGFRAQLITLLLERWAAEREADLLSSRLTEASHSPLSL